MEEAPLLIDKTLEKIEFLLKTAGINIKSGPKTRMATIKIRTVYIINFLWLNIDLSGAVAWFLLGIANSKSFTELTYVAPCITMSFLGNFKSLYLLFREDNIEKLIQLLRNLEMNERARTEDEEKDDIIKFEHNFVTTVISVLKMLYIILIVAFALSPVTLVAFKYYTSNEIELLLPFLIVYPFDAYDIRYWPWVYLRQIWSEVVVVFDICAADFLFYSFCTYMRMQFRLLKHDIERLIPDEALGGQICNIEEARTKLMFLIKWHQDLISCANLLETVYTISTLLNFISSSVLICLTGFNVMAISDIVFVVTFLSFLFMSLLQIFFLCFFGDLMMSSSMEVSDAIYNCHWYLADRRLGKDLLLIQTRAQTPCKLTAFGFAEVNLKAFMKILSTAWSYFALLQTLYGSPT